MKTGLFIKLAIGIIVVFGLLLAGFALWTPAKIRYYIWQFQRGNDRERVAAVDCLLLLEEKGIKALGKEFGNEHEAAFLACHQMKRISNVINDDNRCYVSDVLLKLAVCNKYKYAVEYFILKGADVNYALPEKPYPDKPVYFLHTPFHVAVREGNLNIVKIMIANGADVNFVAYGTETPLDLAENEKIRKLLRSHGAKTGEELKAVQK